MNELDEMLIKQKKRHDFNRIFLSDRLARPQKRLFNKARKEFWWLEDALLCPEQSSSRVL